MEGKEKVPFETTLHIKAESFNLQSLIDLFRKNNIKITELGASNNSSNPYRKTHIPMNDAFLTLNAPQEKVREILLKSDEFKDKIEELLGQGLN